MSSKESKPLAPKVNYHKAMEALLADLDSQAPKPLLLLQACCGPCASYVLERLKAHFRIHVFYDNPNIHGPEEYARRLEALKAVLAKVDPQGAMALTASAYDPAPFFKAVQGLEDLGEGSARCEACIRLRLDRAAAQAQALGADYFASTLSISPHKDATFINETGQALAQARGIPHLPNDFKKKGGYQESTRLCRDWDIYRQDYCGCIFSKKERARQT